MIILFYPYFNVLQQQMFQHDNVQHVFFIYLAISMSTSAWFYGAKNKKFIGYIIASFIISLVGTLPVFIVKYLFYSSKSTIIKEQLLKKKKLMMNMIMMMVTWRLK